MVLCLPGSYNLVRERHSVINYTINKCLVTTVMTAVKKKYRAQCECPKAGCQVGAGDLGCTQNPLTDMAAVSDARIRATVPACKACQT